jgi:2-oxoglutarate dehydrogenase E2 component (dihydrolipoamide succinyltransferase)
MPIDIVIPQAGESVTSGVISRWVKNTGDPVKRDETVLELETDKVTMEVPAPAAGVVTASIPAGATVSIGQVVGSIDPAGVPAGVSAGAGSGASNPTASAAGAAASGAAKPAGATSASMASAGASMQSNGHHADPNALATPLARKTAEEKGVDLSKVKGTFAGGRIREKDVLEAISTVSGGSPAIASGSAVNAVGVDHSAVASRGVTRERMTPLRQRIASRLVQAQHTAAMLTTFNECDMSAVMDLRKQHKEEFEKRHGIGMGFMGFFVRAAVQALRAFPMVNSFIVEDEAGQPAVEKHDYCDVAVAVSTPKGLVVPVLRNCQRLSMAQVESGIKDLAVRARDGKLSLDEMRGGTFTITNGGVFGSLMSTPILNPPQSAILGMHAIKNRAVEHPVGSGQVAIRPMMYLALSYDHRIIDGSEAVQFLVKIKQCIEDPSRLLLDL